MSTAFGSGECIEELLDRFDLTADPASVRPCGRGIVFRFLEPERADRVLSNTAVFARGRLGVLHARQLGGVVIEYRSYTDGNGFSLHIVIGRSGTAFADVDRYNPYQGPVQFCSTEFLNRVRTSYRVCVDGRRRSQPRRRIAGAEMAEAAYSKIAQPFASPTISVIVPVYQEESAIAGLLDNLLELGADELIVVDGGSTDRTAEIAAQSARVLITSPGRAIQMNAGAAVASGEVLLFLHADVRLGCDALEIIRRELADPKRIGGNFDIRFDGEDTAARVFTAIYRWRRRCGIVYGDSGIFCRRETFELLGGYKTWPILEDYEFARRLWKQGRLSLLKEPIQVSDRRWRNGGLWPTLWSWF